MGRSGGIVLSPHHGTCQYNSPRVAARRRFLPREHRMHAPRAVAVAACLSVLLAACGGKPDAAETDAPASTLAVTLAPAQVRPIQRTVVVSGPVAPFEEMQLGVEISGARVTALNVDVGQQVRKGEARKSVV